MPGKGISSSAAIEVAAMQAICAIYGVELPGRELAILCQKVENLVVGAPCGVVVAPSPSWHGAARRQPSMTSPRATSKRRAARRRC
jgi:GHMP kinases N terminal domain